MWAMVYMREFPAPLSELDPDFLEIFFKFANSCTEESIRHGFLKNVKENDSKPTVERMKRLGYSDEDIAKMDL